MDDGKGAIAFHLVMALCADLAIHDEPRLARMQDTLGRLLQDARHPDDRKDLRAAYDALLQLGSNGEPTRLR